ncbi:saccharopine dehydrogenase [Cubamyces sp. BRFM 1775]|nr:saccharopine dehydrogenase [Cubamyces sp. BRFM 1775]
MTPLTHRTIKDGWFKEVFPGCRGQAMTLKVRRILHIERTARQDVLVFESETYGNVLVLEGVVRCTERDEYSYNEMIAHIPLAAHPNPKTVLVIGGGNGGVVREVLKHATVEKIVLHDVDEAVINVSKQYFPSISASFFDPRVTVRIGDASELLEDHASMYDAIIIDEAPGSFYQREKLKGVRDALYPGGILSIQAGSLWLNMDAIGELRAALASVFPMVEYAYAMAPTSPSGQVGIMLACGENGRALKKPLRSVPETRYYNAEVHGAAFVLPQFARAWLEEGKDIRPKFGPEAVALGSPKKRVLLLGSGAVARPCAEYVVRNPANSLTVACRTLSSSEALVRDLRNATGVSLDAGSDDPEKRVALERTIAEHDLVISLVPYIYHVNVIKAAIKGKTDVVTTSYISPAIRALEDEIKEAGIVVMNEIGLDPGVDHLYAIKVIDEVHAKGGKVKEFYSFCGGLPAPECSGNPLGYKFSWSPRGNLLVLLNSATYLSEGQQVEVPGKDLMSIARPYFISPAYAFVAFPNRNSVPFRETYGIPEAETVMRGSLRYQGFPEFVMALVKLGLLDMEKKPWLTEGLTWAEVTQRAIGASVRDANLLDTLCARLEPLMRFDEDERDLVILQHKFVVEWADGRRDTITSTLEAYGETGGHSAMARYVGVPCGIAVQMVLDRFFGAPGIYAPHSKEVCDPIRAIIEAEGMGLVEKVL